MNKGKILITPRSLSKDGHPYLKHLTAAGFELLMPFPGRQPTEDELLAVLPECAGYLAGVEKVTGKVLAACRCLQVISRNGVGIDNVDPVAAAKKGIVLKVARGANSRGVAELAICEMLTLMRGLVSTSNSIKAGGWTRKLGTEVCGKTLGIIGTGQIGQDVAKLARGLDMKVIAYDLYPNMELRQESVFEYRELRSVLGSADVISLHCPAGERPLLDAAALAGMKDGVFIINTARAGLVDDDALLAALESGKVAGYAVDAFATEPPELTALHRHPHVILSAHIGGFTTESVDRATEAAVDNILTELQKDSV